MSDGAEGPVDFSDVSVVMITLNEEEAIAKVITDTMTSLPGAEVIVVDGSSDATPEIAASFRGASHSRARW